MIVRIVKRENPYVQIDKKALSDKRLSWRAKGILAYLLGKPDDWIASVPDIIENGRDGRESVQSALKELRSAGYAKLQTVRNERGQTTGKEWIIMETPTDGFTVNRANRKTVKPLNGQTAPTNNDNTNKEKDQERKAGVDFSIFWDAYGFKQGSKRDAEKKWNSLSPTVQAEILRVLPAYLHATTTSDAGRVGGRFIPMRKYPLSFLNGRIWENYTDAAPNGSAPVADTLPDDLRPLYQNYLTWLKQHYPGAAAKGIQLTPSQFQAFKTTIYVSGVRAMGHAAEMKRFELAHETMAVDGPQARQYRDVFEYHCHLIAEHAKARTV